MRNKGKKLRKKMGRAPCCIKGEVKKGAWTPEEDKLLVDYITNNGHGTWRSFPKAAGLRRCGKSCRLRWANYLRPDIKRGAFSFEEEQTIFNLHSLYGNKWATIASQLPGRTDNEIKNLWNSHLRKRIPKINLSSMSTNVKTEWENTQVETEPEPETMLSANVKTEWEITQVEPEPEPEPEPETLLSVDSMLLSPETVMTDENNVLHEWGSSDGEPFQKHMGFDEMACEIPTLRAIKFESDFVDTVQTGPQFAVTSTSESCDHSVKEHIRFKEEAEEMVNVSESQNSYEDENGSDITLDLLLDFPSDGEYLQYV